MGRQSAVGRTIREIKSIQTCEQVRYIVSDLDKLVQKFSTLNTQNSFIQSEKPASQTAAELWSNGKSLRTWNRRRRSEVPTVLACVLDSTQSHPALPIPR